MEIAVVGGSLGGLTAACLLADDGHHVVVYERSPSELEERGAGIGLLPATYRYPVERGGVCLDSIAVSTDHIRYLTGDGGIIHDDAHRYLFSSWNTVYREMLGCFDREAYMLGHELAGIEVEPLRLTFANGLAVEPDLAVFADGVGSTARATLLPSARPEYSGYVAWRGVVPETKLSDATRAALDDAITYYVYANSHILVYPIPGRNGSVAPGGRLINFVWYRNYLAGGDLDSLLVDVGGVHRDVSVPPGALRPEHVAEARAVAAARLPPPVAEVVLAVDDLFVQVVLDLEVERMAFGRACLLGDAAFVVRPHAAAGTAKAADDAWKLRDALAQHGDDAAAALRAWEPGQLALGHQLLARTRAIGRRSQVDCNWRAGDPELIFGLHGPGR
ncbi:MAG TPA: NAD(P)-binding protein [Ilumatobacteraceae bacterium]|nr:NAD(P)-binding protein [Ilumatobacteraceae bacterium]